jgi:hypothetical protein
MGRGASGTPAGSERKGKTLPKRKSVEVVGVV